MLLDRCCRLLLLSGLRDACSSDCRFRVRRLQLLGLLQHGGCFVELALPQQNVSQSEQHIYVLWSVTQHAPVLRLCLLPLAVPCKQAGAPAFSFKIVGSGGQSVVHNLRRFGQMTGSNLVAHTRKPVAFIKREQRRGDRDQKECKRQSLCPQQSNMCADSHCDPTASSLPLPCHSTMPVFGLLSYRLNRQPTSIAGR